MTIDTLNSTSAQAGESVFSQSSALPSKLQGLMAEPIDIHPALEEVRKLKEFQPPQPSPLDEWLKNQPWLKQVSDTFGDLLEAFFSNIGKLFGNIRPEGMLHLPQNIRDVFSGFIGFILILAGLYAFYLLLTLILRWKEGRSKNRPENARLFEETVLVNSEHHYRNARQAAQAKDYGTGIRELYMATLCLLDEKTLVPYNTSLTNLEYQASLSQQADPVRSNFGSLAKRFESVRYGGRPADPAQFEHTHEAFQQLQSGLTVKHG